MKKRLLSLIVILSIVPSVLLKAQEVAFKVSAPPSVVVGTQFQILYMVNKENSIDFRVAPDFSETFELLYHGTGSSSSTQYVNGKVTRVESLTHTLTVIAKKEGTFTIGPATIKIGRSDYKSDSFTINVLPQDKTTQQQVQGGGGQQQSDGSTNNASSALSNDNIFLRMDISKRSVYEQEGFLVTFKIYSVSPLSKLGNIKFPEFEGFLMQDFNITEIDHLLEQYNGRNYNTYAIKKVILYPQRSGQITIGGSKVEVFVRERTQTRVRSIFEGFFDTYTEVKKDLTSSPVSIDVKPLPPSKPANFSSAVGSYTMTSEINRTEMKANEAVTIKLTIKGNGNIKVLKNPEVKFPNDFDVYEPVPKTNTNITTAGVSGTKTIEYMAIPRYAGDFEIPPISFSFFDLQSGAYKTLTTEAYKLNVEKDANSPDAPVISNYTNQQNLRFLGKDIHYLKTQNIHFKQYKDIFFGSFLYILIYLMIALLFIIFFIVYRKQVRENANIALVRTKKANKTAAKRLKQAEKLLQENNEEAFYEEILRALWGYLSDKLNIPQSELTKENVAMELTKYGVDETLSDEFLNIIHTCEYTRYAPNKVSGAMDKLFRETIDAIDKMENTIKK